MSSDMSLLDDVIRDVNEHGIQALQFAERDRVVDRIRIRMMLLCY